MAALARVPISALLLLPAAALANNGLNMIGFGAESTMMGGADLAVARDTTALNTNPAGLSQIATAATDAYFAVAYALDVAHADRFGNDEKVSNEFIALGGFGYSRPVTGNPITLGIGLFAQGGAGNVYEDLNTAFGSQDELSAIFRIAKLTPGASWRVNESLSLGAALAVFYADINQKIFPDTSFFDQANPTASFFGSELKRARAIDYGAKLGAQYKPSDALTFAFSYTTETELELDDGKLEVNMAAIGLGKVRYRDAQIEGLSQPREIGIGVALRPARALLLALELNWIDWSNAVKSAMLTASNPDHPAAPPVLRSTSTLDWRDENVFAIGAAYELGTRSVIRAGYNYGRNPIPASTTNPLLAAISEHALTLGYGRRLSPRWEVSTGVEYALPEKVTYTNPQLPFGPNAEERNEFIVLHLMLSRRW